MRLTICPASTFEITGRDLRLIIAFAVAPLAPVLLWCGVLPTAGTFVLGAAFSYSAEILFGIPLFWRARYLNRVTRDGCIGGGFISGAALPTLLAVLYAIENWSGIFSTEFWYVMLQLTLGSGLVFGICGAIAGGYLPCSRAFQRLQVNIRESVDLQIVRGRGAFGSGTPMRLLTVALLLSFAPLAAQADDLLNPPHPALAAIQASFDHCRDTQPGNINEMLCAIEADKAVDGVLNTLYEPTNRRAQS